MPTRIYISMLAAATALAVPATACETCAVYTPPGWGSYLSAEDEDAVDFKLNWFSRYSVLDTRLDGSHESDNRGERIESWISQLSLAHKTTDRLKTQISIPYLSRSFRSHDDGELVSDSESGIGDITLLAKYRAAEKVDDNGIVKWIVIGGVKTPTGDPDRINEGAGHEDEPHGHGGEPAEHHGDDADGHDASAISGHDVTLGSGSWDAVFGTRIEKRSGDWFADAMALYYLRTEGDHDYEFSDDLYVSAHVGKYFVNEGRRAVSLRAGLLGEFRDADEHRGVDIDHTDVDSVYADATLLIARDDLIAEAGIDIPLDQHAAAATLVPDYRVRFSLGLHF